MMNDYVDMNIEEPLWDYEWMCELHLMHKELHPEYGQERMVDHSDSG